MQIRFQSRKLQVKQQKLLQNKNKAHRRPFGIEGINSHPEVAKLDRLKIYECK